jgi:hypothetical protein
VAGKPAIVWCADSDTSWKTFLATRYGAPSETSMSDEPREERLERIERDAAFGIAFHRGHTLARRGDPPARIS